MVAYELLQKLEKLSYFNDLLKSGVVPVNWLDYKFIYEWYLDEVKRLKDSGLSATKSKVQARSNASEEFKIGESTVRWIIKKLRS